MTGFLVTSEIVVAGRDEAQRPDAADANHQRHRALDLIGLVVAASCMACAPRAAAEEPMADSSGRAPMVEVGNSETSGRVLEPTSETPVTALLAEGSIADTPDNRAVLAVCERYRRAVEDKDIDLLLELAAPSYLDDGGTPDPSDDVDRTALVDSLRRTFRASYKVQYAFRYQSITWEGDVARVDYRYTASFRHRDRLQQLGDTNQLVLVRSGDTFLLLSGM